MLATYPITEDCLITEGVNVAVSGVLNNRHQFPVLIGKILIVHDIVVNEGDASYVVGVLQQEMELGENERDGRQIQVL